MSQTVWTVIFFPTAMLLGATRSYRLLSHRQYLWAGVALWTAWATTYLMRRDWPNTVAALMIGALDYWWTSRRDSDDEDGPRRKRKQLLGSVKAKLRTFAPGMVPAPLKGGT